MSIIEELGDVKAEEISEIVASGILPTICVINTKYTNGLEDFSGSGLLVSDEQRKYILTANHVLDPLTRKPARVDSVKRSYHSLGLKRWESTSQLYMLRMKYFCSVEHDLGLIESSVSERPDIDDGDYYPIEKLLKPVPDPFVDDFFAICGFPASGRFAIPATSEIKHGLHIHYFTGKHTRQDPKDNARVRVKFDASIPPAGMSGSPVWLIRQKHDADSPLTIPTLKESSPHELQLSAQFVGVVIEYFESSQEISVIKPAVCAKFAQHAIPVIPGLRDQAEDAWIKVQLGGRV